MFRQANDQNNLNANYLPARLNPTVPPFSMHTYVTTSFVNGRSSQLSQDFLPAALALPNIGMPEHALTQTQIERLGTGSITTMTGAFCNNATSNLFECKPCHFVASTTEQAKRHFYGTPNARLLHINTNLICVPCIKDKNAVFCFENVTAHDRHEAVHHPAPSNQLPPAIKQEESSTTFSSDQSEVDSLKPSRPRKKQKLKNPTPAPERVLFTPSSKEASTLKKGGAEIKTLKNTFARPSHFAALFAAANSPLSSAPAPHAQFFTSAAGAVSKQTISTTPLRLNAPKRSH